MDDAADWLRADVAEAAEHLDAAHRLLARAKHGLGCPCGPPALREALESTDTAWRRAQEVLQPVPGD